MINGKKMIKYLNIFCLILVAECVSYFTIFGLIPLLRGDLEFFDYFFTVINYDFNKLLVCITLFIIVSNFETVTSKTTKLLAIAIFIIGINIFIANTNFCLLRFGGFTLRNLVEFQQKFGVLVYYFYSTCMIIVSGKFIYDYISQKMTLKKSSELKCI